MVRADRKQHDTPEADTTFSLPIDSLRGVLQEAEFSFGDRFPLPFDSLDALKARGFSSDEIYAIVAPRRTLARRKEHGEDLTVAESDRVLRLQRVSDLADSVFADREKAQRWLRKKSRVLNEVPITLLRSETGAHIVTEELHRIEYGVYA